MSTAPTTVTQDGSAPSRPPLVIGPAPYTHAALTRQTITSVFTAALVPALGVAIHLFGWRSLAVAVLAVAGAYGAEVLARWARGRSLAVPAGPALVTGLVLALSLPPGVPLWLPVVGALFGVLVAQELFGGYGYQLFHPAMVGRVFLMVSFPALMGGWLQPFDLVTGATPLAQLREGAGLDVWRLFAGTTAGSLGETSAPAILLGGALLLASRVADWRPVVGMLATVAAMGWAFGEPPLTELLAGGVLFGAFFVTTDPVTTPLTRLGRLLFGVGAGAVTMVIRLWASYPEGVAFSILFMNSLVPLVNLLTRPRPRKGATAGA
ncbi:RnfABCDGE type electron transport complex subunit D [Limnochorda pilosa]|uniref:Ion-translocating oxidoreductase complex subunit D n=1 Tax=Limnochorda pilosa TaxID=1555112 RepID=A0A0K2SQ74_LIMPI|nr:RnfABCDGE type electron transport complex subunit D [Limnochorda pilosa]BAS29246.1 NADH:ubiquinone oxidoreductase [Limnochorda pilosa]